MPPACGGPEGPGMAPGPSCSNQLAAARSGSSLPACGGPGQGAARNTRGARSRTSRTWSALPTRSGSPRTASKALRSARSPRSPRTAAAGLRRSRYREPAAPASATADGVARAHIHEPPPAPPPDMPPQVARAFTRALAKAPEQSIHGSCASTCQASPHTADASPHLRGAPSDTGSEQPREDLLYEFKGGGLRPPPAPAAGGRKRPSSPGARTAPDPGSRGGVQRVTRASEAASTA